MFSLADDIRAYPQFLPWCEAAEEEKREGEEVRATLHIRYFGLATSFTTDNRHCRPSSIDMRLAAGPLKTLSGGWRFTDLPDGRCKAEFFLEWQFMRGVLGAAFERVFDSIFAKFVDCFIRRAEEQFGKGISVTLAVAEEGERTLHLPAGATVADALIAGGHAGAESAGVFGKECSRQTPLSCGDRVEVYHPLRNDPRTARRQRAKE